MNIINVIIKKFKSFLIRYRYIVLIFFTLISAYFIFSNLEYTLDITSKYKFETLGDLEKYANFYPENYELENNDWEDPTFFNLYKTKMRHSIIDKIFIRLGFKDIPVWNVYKFRDLIRKITDDRLSKKLINPFDKNVELKNDYKELENGYKVIIFGGFHSAFHSLVRNLEELEKQKIIDNNLKIISPKTILVILGDAIDRGPYSLEVLNVLLTLIEKNPEMVTYLRGNHESPGGKNWRNFNTKRQIKILFPSLVQTKAKGNILIKEEKDNLFNDLDKFFDTLPDSLTINIKATKEKIILSYAEIRKLFENKNDVKFIILGEKRFDVLKESTGLEFVGYDYGAAKWATMVNPTPVYKKFFKFHYDAFLELTIGSSAQNCILTLCNRDVLENDPEYKKTSYDPIFSHKLKNKSPFVPKNIFHIGSTMGLTGLNAAVCTEHKIGFETSTFLNNQNNENLILPVILDDGYSPRIAKSNINKLLNIYSINTILAPTGTPTLSFYLNMIKSGKVYVFFPDTGAVIFRDKNIKNILHFRPSYTQEVKTSIGYLIKTRAIKNFAFFYQNDSFGKPIADSAQKELEKNGIKNWTDLPCLKTQEEFGDTIDKIKSSMPEAIGCFASAGPTTKFIDELGIDFFAGRILFGISILFNDAFKKYLDARGIKYILTDVVADPETSELEIAKEFKKEMNLRLLNKSSSSLEGYISVSLFSDAIKKIKPPVTTEKIMKYFESMKNYNFKGLILTFNPETRDLSQPIWLRTLDLKWVIYKI